MALYKGTVKLDGIETGFLPENVGSTGQVLKKTATGYAWANESGGGGGTYTAGNGINISINNEISVDTSVVATQTDLVSKADDSAVVHNTGAETVAGVKTFSSSPVVPAPTNNTDATTKKYVDDRDVYIGTAAPTDNLVEGRLWYDTTNDVLKTYDGTNWNEIGKEYDAGVGIGISNTINGRQGPSPVGFHIPTQSDWTGVETIMDSLNLTSITQYSTTLLLPCMGRRGIDGALSGVGTEFSYYTSSSACTSYSDTWGAACMADGMLSDSCVERATGLPIRSFKDEYVAPDSNWTVIYGTLGSAGIFWNQSKGLISITNGTNGYTMMDKNLGATVVYNYGDTLTDANMGYYYQWGNNYGFPATGTLPNISTTKVDTSSYGPGNYYSSSTYIDTSGYEFPDTDWSVVQNNNLWGDITPVVVVPGGGIISNTGVLSVNGETGDVIVDTPNVKVFYIETPSDSNAQEAVNWYFAGGTPIISYGTGSYLLYEAIPGSLKFRSTGLEYYDYHDQGVSKLGYKCIQINFNNSTHIVYGGAIDVGWDDPYLRTDVNYTTPYTPAYNGSPATKKYVDDKTPIVSTTAPSSPTEGMLWYDTTNDILKTYDGTSWNVTSDFPGMTILSYGHNTWQDFLDAYNNNAIVYCKASSNSNPGSGTQGRMAFMAYVSVNSGTGVPTSVEFQYYRSRSDHNTDANQLDQVFVYTLTSNNGGTWSVTERNTAAKAVAGTGISLTFGNGNMTISNTGVTSVNGQTGTVVTQDVYTRSGYDALPSSKNSDNAFYFIKE